MFPHQNNMTFSSKSNNTDIKNYKKHSTKIVKNRLKYIKKTYLKKKYLKKYIKKYLKKYLKIYLKK